MNDRHDHLERCAMEMFPRDHRRALAVLIKIDEGQADIVLWRRCREKLARQDVVEEQHVAFAKRQERKERGPEFPDSGFFGGGS